MTGTLIQYRLLYILHTQSQDPSEFPYLTWEEVGKRYPKEPCTHTTDLVVVVKSEPSPPPDIGS